MAVRQHGWMCTEKGLAKAQATARDIESSLSSYRRDTEILKEHERRRPS